MRAKSWLKVITLAAVVVILVAGLFHWWLNSTDASPQGAGVHEFMIEGRESHRGGGLGRMRSIESAPYVEPAAGKWISLRFVDPRGQQVPGVAVFSGSDVVARADSSGLARVSRDVSGALVCAHEGFLPRRWDVPDDPASGDYPHVIVIRRGESLRGTVVDQDGMPVEGADVLVTRGAVNWVGECKVAGGMEAGSFSGQADTLVYRRCTRSAADGHFEVGGLVAGEHLLVVETPGHVMAGLLPQIAVETGSTTTIRMQRTYLAVLSFNSAGRSVSSISSGLSYWVTLPQSLGGLESLPPAFSGVERRIWSRLRSIAGKGRMLDFVRRALPESDILGGIELQVDYGCGSRRSGTVALKFVPTDRFRPEDVVVVDVSQPAEYGKTSRLIIESDVDVLAISRDSEIGSATFRPVKREDGLQVFQIPAGDYAICAEGGPLLEQLNRKLVRLKPGESLQETFTVKDRVGRMEVTVLDAAGRETNNYILGIRSRKSYMSRYGRLEGPHISLPCMHGAYRLRLRDEAGRWRSDWIDVEVSAEQPVVRVNLRSR